MKTFKKNQIVIFVIALMLVTAGYLNFTNEQKDLIPTSSLLDSEQMASIGDATLVSANSEQNQLTNLVSSNTTNEANATSSNVVENEIQNNSLKQTNQTEDIYFTQSRLDRENMYSQMLANYQKVLETTNISSEEKANAQTEIEKINKEKNAIMVAENLIKTKGFEDVVLFVNSGNVSAVIKAEKLDENQIAQIQNVITRELNVKVNKINVSSVK
ncbi:MAG: SpoIIIAH-like family protein [Clostridia bacterium]|nr:SpoIIIAH-like family protein [Clostridia bacterium]